MRTRKPLRDRPPPQNLHDRFNMAPSNRSPRQRRGSSRVGEIRECLVDHDHFFRIHRESCCGLYGCQIQHTSAGTGTSHYFIAKNLVKLINLGLHCRYISLFEGYRLGLQERQRQRPVHKT